MLTAPFALGPDDGERLVFGDVTIGQGRLLVLTSPGGFEGFFRELAAAQEAGTLGPEAYAGASQRYRITWLG